MQKTLMLYKVPELWELEMKGIGHFIISFPKCYQTETNLTTI